MKILKIRFCNINSLKDTHEIDFSKEPLASSGLFAITGVTGSGKTTILDVITLALYNRIPRIKTISTNVIKKNGVILTRNMPDGFAEVIYECASGTFRSKWSVSKTRTGTFRDYEMEIADANTGALLEDVGRAKVPDKNEELIGLSYDQFVRAILLAQGDFATFLKSNENERGKLLEQITGGEIYRKLGMKAFEMNSIHGAELKRIKDRKLVHEESLLKKDDYKVLAEQLKKAEESITTLNKKKETLGLSVKLKNDIAGSEKKIQALTLQQEKLKVDLDTFNQNQGLLLQKHKALVPVQDKLIRWKQETEKSIEADLKLERTRNNIAGFKGTIELIKSQVVTLTQNAVDNPIEALAQLESKVIKLDQKIAAETGKLSEKTTAIRQLANEINITFDPANIPEFKQTIDQKVTSTQNQFKDIETLLGKEVLEHPKEALAGHRASLSAIAGVIRVQDRISQLQKNLTDNETARSAVKVLLKDLPGKIDIKSQEVTNLKLQLELNRADIENRNLRASLEEHRRNLKEGNPCPLCGALEHPYFRDEATKSDELLKKTEELETAYNKENASLISMHNQLEGAVARETELLTTKNTITEQVKEQSDERDVLLESVPEIYRKQEMSEAQVELESHIPIIENYQELVAKKKKLTDISNHLGLAVQIEAVFTKLRKERTGLYSGTDFTERINGIRAEWLSAQNNLKNYEEVLKETSEEQIALRNSIDDLSHLILPIASKLGYNDLPGAFADLLSAEKAEALTGEKGEIDRQINESKTEFRVAGESLKEMKKKDSTSSLEDLEEVVKENNEKLQQISGERDNWLITKNNHDANKLEVAKLDKLIEELGKKNRKWDLLNKYIGDAEGKRFSTFAQTLTLYQLIIHANKRLAMLDDRYVLSIPNEEEDKSLSVIDQHMGDVRRSVKSLSGGETFLISLALALALSDLAARKVELKSLFIDEGFGSLDKLTLDQTIDTLEKLQYESGKNIGVISHVEAMQERITTQIMVSKNGQGHSKIEIV